MKRLMAQIQALIRELRRRQVIRVAVVYATTGFVILQLGEILVEPFGLGGWALRLVLFLLILGFPLAIGLAWVCNITEEGVVQAGEGEAVEPGSSRATLASNGLIMGLLIVAVGLLLYPRVFLSGDQASGQAPASTPDTAKIDERSIAVLPFQPLSSGEESKTFSRGVHDDLLTRLANVSDLKAQLTAGEQERTPGAPTEDLTAYRLYIMGWRQLARRTVGSGDHVRQALRHFRRAIERDSSFALAWSGLSDARAFYPQFTPDSVEAPAVEQKRAARRARKLDPNLAEAHASMGLVHQRNLNAPAALEALQRAIDLKPSYWAAHHWLGELYLHIGRPQEAVARKLACTAA